MGGEEDKDGMKYDDDGINAPAITSVTYCTSTKIRSYVTCIF